MIKFLLVFFSFNISSANNVEQSEGFLFSINGKDFFTEQLNTSFPEELVLWKNPENRKNICFSNVPGKCHSYKLQFVRMRDKKGLVILSQAKVVPIFDDPVARSNFLRKNKN